MENSWGLVAHWADYGKKFQVSSDELKAIIREAWEDIESSNLIRENRSIHRVGLWSVDIKYGVSCQQFREGDTIAIIK